MSIAADIGNLLTLFEEGMGCLEEAVEVMESSIMGVVGVVVKGGGPRKRGEGRQIYRAGQGEHHT